jgi:hypothetical protein
MLRTLLVAAAAATRAPQIDSIRQDDLRADLFFLAGDSLRGRLTVNDAKLEKILRLIHQASWEIANADLRPNSR